MKGRRKEMIRDELHQQLCKGLAYQPYILNTEWQSYYHKPIRWEKAFECPSGHNGAT
jgi:hypothetical protein